MLNFPLTKQNQTPVSHFDLISGQYMFHSQATPGKEKYVFFACDNVEQSDTWARSALRAPPSSVYVLSFNLEGQEGMYSILSVFVTALAAGLLNG